MKISEILALADKASLQGKDSSHNNTFGSFSPENKAYLKAIPEMEDKLRSIVKLMPEILETINYAHFVTQSGLYKDIFKKEIDKLERWLND